MMTIIKSICENCGDPVISFDNFTWAHGTIFEGRPFLTPINSMCIDPKGDKSKSKIIKNALMTLEANEEKKNEKYAAMTFKVKIKDTDTPDQIEEKMFHEIESYLDVIGIRIDCIDIVN